MTGAAGSVGAGVTGVSRLASPIVRAHNFALRMLRRCVVAELLLHLHRAIEVALRVSSWTGECGVGDDAAIGSYAGRRDDLARSASSTRTEIGSLKLPGPSRPSSAGRSVSQCSPTRNGTPKGSGR